MPVRKFAALFVLLTMFMPLAVHAQGIERQKLRFAPGASQAVINSVVAGRQTIDYIVNARRGQTMSIRFAPSSSAAYFNLLAPNGEALFVGQSQGNPGRFTARLGQSGDYAIRVYLVRSAARRGERASFRLTVSVAGAAPAPAPEEPGIADDGGPDFYVVAGLTPGDRLNMRAAPSAAAPVITSYRNGKILRNLGCRRTATQRWCNVENPDRRGERGYVNGRFLRESGAPGRPVRPPEEDALVPGTNYNATGEIDCAISGYPRATSCRFGVTRGRGPDEATVFVTLPDGENRAFGFEDGAVRPLFGVSNFRYARSGDSWLLNVNNGQERYTVYDAVVNGG
jgi:hypothetical protein